MPADIIIPKLKILTADALCDSCVDKAPVKIKQIAPIKIDAQAMRRKEFNIRAPSSVPMRLCRAKNSIKKLFIADMDVARASPPTFNGNISAKFNATLTSKDMAAILSGVFVSCIA